MNSERVHFPSNVWKSLEAAADILRAFSVDYILPQRKKTACEIFPALKRNSFWSDSFNWGKMLITRSRFELSFCHGDCARYFSVLGGQCEIVQSRETLLEVHFAFCLPEHRREMIWDKRQLGRPIRSNALCRFHTLEIYARAENATTFWGSCIKLSRICSN